MITPTFHFDILKSYLPIINEQADILIDVLDRKFKNDEEIDAFYTMTLATLDIICGYLNKYYIYFVSLALYKKIAIYFKRNCNGNKYKCTKQFAK